MHEAPLTGFTTPCPNLNPHFSLPLLCKVESDDQCVQGKADLQSTIQQQSSDIASLREQCSNHAKERAALKTILDAKIKALVDDIGQSVADLPPEVRQSVCCYVAYTQIHV